MTIRNKFFLFPAALTLLLAGCSHHEPEHSGSVMQPPTITVESIVPVRDGGEVVLVPKSALFMRGEMVGLYVVGRDNRLSLRWIRIGRTVHDEVVVLGGLDKGESVVGSYTPELMDGVTVKKSQHTTEEVQSR